METTQTLPTSNPGESALHCARLGWEVLPCWSIVDESCSCGRSDCSSPGKHPNALLAPNGLKNATTDLALIGGWWSQYPNANVAVCTGLRSGLLVCDIDPRHGGDESFERLEREKGPLPSTLRVKTGGGGWHIYLSWPGGHEKLRTKLREYPGIDFKGDGGYVIAPPSNHISGDRYVWVTS